ncbi:Lipase 5 [Savitreella phatthalungensis]
MGVLGLLGLSFDSQQVRTAKQNLANATTFHDYEMAALSLDFLEGRDKWKADPHSGDYDANLIQIRTRQLRAARLEQDRQRVLFLLRTTLSRNLGRMGNSKLYTYSFIGTKHLIEEYIAEVQYACRYVMESPTDIQDTIDIFLKTRQAFGRTALLLSGGGTLGMMHIGVVKSLFEEKCLPRIICGSSAGAIIAAVVCTRTDEQLPSLTSSFAAGNLAVFGHDSVFTKLGRFLKHGVLLDIAYLRGVMSEWMGDITFAEAFNKTRRILNITVSSASLYEMPRLLNYITAPNVVIWSAVAASSSLPLIFSGSPLLAKDPRTGNIVVWEEGSNKCIDGSIEGDLPTAKLSELFNIDHFIVSQVNPHVTPFIREEVGLLPNLAVNEAVHLSEVMVALGVLPNLAQRIAGLLNQPYQGDITILPEAPMIAGLRKLLANPTPAFMEDACRRGERATWQKMSIIRNHLQIELSLDRTLHELRLALIGQDRPSLRQSQSQYFGAAGLLPGDGRQHRRRRSSSILVNPSLELDPADIAPTRERDPKTKSQPATPANLLSPTHHPFMPPSSRQPSRRPSMDHIDPLSGTGLGSASTPLLAAPGTPAAGLLPNDYFAQYFGGGSGLNSAAKGLSSPYVATTTTSSGHHVSSPYHVRLRD